MVKRENSTLIGVPNWALTPPLARLVEPMPAAPKRSTTRTRPRLERRASAAIARPTAPAPITTISRPATSPSGRQMRELAHHPSLLDDHEKARLGLGQHRQVLERVSVHHE